jgi:hypothetical protein
MTHRPGTHSLFHIENSHVEADQDHVR